jgi:VanZ family protein
MRKTEMRHNLFYGLPVLAYAGMIFLLSSLSHLPESAPSFAGFDKLAHGAEYALFGCLIIRWLLTRSPAVSGGQAAGLTLLIGILFALSDEWHQSFIPGRDAAFADVLADSGGLLTSLAYPGMARRIAALRRLEEGIERICRDGA